MGAYYSTRQTSSQRNFVPWVSCMLEIHVKALQDSWMNPLVIRRLYNKSWFHNCFALTRSQHRTRIFIASNARASCAFSFSLSLSLSLLPFFFYGNDNSHSRVKWSLLNNLKRQEGRKIVVTVKSDRNRSPFWFLDFVHFLF